MSKYFEEEKWVKRIDLVFHGSVLSVRTDSAFSVLTRSKWVGTLLTLILIGVSVWKGFFHNEWIIFIDVVSLAAGYLIIDRLQFHKHQDDE